MLDNSTIDFAVQGLLESRYTYEPAMASIPIKHIKEIYIACQKAQSNKKSKSEICLNLSTFILGAASVMGIFQLLKTVILLFAIAVVVYVLYMFARKEETNDINNIAIEIMRLMPLSEQEIDQAIDNDQRIREARVTSYIKHSQSPY